MKLMNENNLHAFFLPEIAGYEYSWRLIYGNRNSSESVGEKLENWMRQSKVFHR